MDTPTPRSVRTIYKGRIFTVEVESMTRPDGGRFELEMVRHPGSVVIVPMTDAGEIVLVRQYRPALGRSIWELPAGSLKPGENVDSAAARECHEEIGLIPSRLEPLGAFFPTPGYCDEEMHFYRATGLRTPAKDDQVAVPDEDEDIEARPFAVNAVWLMIRGGEIIDLKTIAGVALISMPS